MNSNRNKQKKASSIERKPDITKNGDLIDNLIEAQREREKSLYPIRVSSTTVIYVTKKKATKEYADEYKRTKLMRLE